MLLVLVGYALTFITAWWLSLLFLFADYVLAIIAAGLECCCCHVAVPFDADMVDDNKKNKWSTTNG